MKDQAVPMFEVDLTILQHVPRLDWPSASDFRRWSENGHLTNHQFIDLRGMDWEIAEMLLDGDKSILQRALARSSSPQEFMDVLKEAEEEVIYGPDSEYEAAYFSFEAGIHGVIGVLAASGCAPLTGCSGHHGNPPYVIFWCRNNRFALIRDAANSTGVGLTTNEYGTLEVFSDCLPRLILFAEKVLDLAKERGLNSRD